MWFFHETVHTQQYTLNTINVMTESNEFLIKEFWDMFWSIKSLLSPALRVPF